MKKHIVSSYILGCIFICTVGLWPQSSNDMPLDPLYINELPIDGKVNKASTGLLEDVAPISDIIQIPTEPPPGVVVYPTKPVSSSMEESGRVSAGRYHSLMIKDDGTVWSCGGNSRGQLGIGNEIDQTKTVQVLSLSNAIYVSAGMQYSAAVLEDGTVWAWGSNVNGELGNGTTQQSSVPIKVQIPNTVINIATGFNHMLAIDEDGYVWAWGANEYGQLGDGTTVEKTIPYQIPGISQAVDVAAGADHSIIVCEDGTVWAFGKNTNGQLGIGNIDEQHYPMQVALDEDIEYAVCGAYHTIVLDSNGRPWSWGRNVEGQLGDGTTTRRESPVQAPILGGFEKLTMVSAGERHTIARCVKENWSLSGTLISVDVKYIGWGSNNNGELGDGTQDGSGDPVSIKMPLEENKNGTELKPIIAIAGGGNHSIAVRSDGMIYGWGKNNHGQLGIGTVMDTSIPTFDCYSSSKISMGFQYSLYLNPDGTVSSWGSNYYGTLGNGTNTNSEIPVIVNNLSNVIEISSGAYFSMALREDGTVWCWGRNVDGELGNGTNENSNIPIQVSGLGDIVSIAALHLSAAALRADGTVWTWGLNSYGQLGNGTNTNSNIPVQVQGLTDIVSISRGVNHMVAVRNDGTVWTWGNGLSGALGDGNSTNSNIPIQVQGINNIISASSGYMFSIALSNDNNVYVWGANNYGQLGLGTTGTELPPMQNENLSNIRTIKSGIYATAVVDQNNKLWTFGRGSQSELGSGNSTDILVPEMIESLNGIANIGFNWYHAAVICSDGSIWGWGINSYGEIGDRTTERRWEPVQLTVIDIEDTSPPVLTLQRYADGTLFDDNNWKSASSVSVQAAAQDAASGINASTFQYSIDNQNTWILGDEVEIVTEGETTVFFRVEDNSGNEASSSVLVRIDRTFPTYSQPPMFAASASEGAVLFYTESELDFEDVFVIDDQPGLSGLDADSVVFNLQGSEFWVHNVNPTPVSQLGTGLIQLRVRFSDNAGNVVETPWLFTTIDTDPPIINDPSSDLWSNGTGLSITADDGSGSGINTSTWRWKMSSASIWQTFPISSLPEGENLIDVEVYDYAGNRAGLNNILVKIDYSNPIVSSSIQTGGITSGVYENIESVVIQGNVDAGIGAPIVSMSYSINSGISQTWDGSDITITSEGSSIIVFSATDAAGNTGESDPIEICIDRTSPSINFLITPAGVSQAVWTNEEINVAVQLQDIGGAGLNSGATRYSIDDGNNWSSSYNSLISTQGKNTLIVQAFDNVGNGVTEEVEIWIDKDGPVVSGTVDDFCNVINGTISFSGLSAEDELAGMDSESVWYYSIDENDFVEFSVESGIVSSTMLSDRSLTEGAHTIVFRTTDILGNIGTSAALAFSVDYTAPAINSVNVIDGNGETVIADDYLATNTGDLQINMTDTYINEGTSIPNNPVGFYYLLSTESLSFPMIDSAVYQTGNMTSGSALTNLSTGVNYVYVWPVDIAGNIGEEYERVILFDNESPLAPVLTSTTHKEAVFVTDAVPFTDVIFLVSPKGSAASGISGYLYSLYKGNDEILSGDIEGDGLQTLEFTGLPDNLTDEFYRLSISAIAGNGKTGLSTEYQFRIDTQPPVELSLYADPHLNDDLWYNKKTTTLFWKKPVDMTGVKDYYYTISLSQITLPETSEDDSIDLSQWTIIDDESKVINLSTELGAESGIAYAYLCAQDYSGNNVFASKVIRFDTIDPWLDEYSADTYLTASVDMNERTAVINHLDAHDNISEENVSVMVRLSCQSEDGNLSVVRDFRETSDNEVTFIGLDPEATYFAEVEVLDVATNTTNYMLPFRLDGEEVEILFLPFAEKYEGYDISGMRSLGPGLSNGTLNASDKIQLVEYVDGDILEGPFEIDSLEFSNVGELLSASFDEEREFGLTIHGFEIIGTGAGFDPENGFTLANISFSGKRYNPDMNEDEDVSTLMSGFKAGFASLFAFLTSPFTSHETDPFIFRSKTDDQYESFVLNTPEESGLEDESYVLNGSKWDTSFLFNSFAVDIYSMIDNGDGNVEKQQIVTITKANINYKDVITGSDLQLPVYIESESALIEVTDGWIENDALIVAESHMILPEGFTPQNPIIRNFTVGLDGTFTQLTDYYSEGFTYVDESGNIYEFNSIGITSDGTFLGTDGTLIVSNATSDEYELSNMQIGQDGPVYENPATINQSVEITVAGFTVQSTDTVLTSGGLLLRTAVITNMPVQFGGGANRTISDLGINLSDHSVFQPGISEESFTVISQSYGGNIYVNNLELNGDGLFAPYSMIELGDDILYEEKRLLPCSDLELLYTGGLGSGDIETDDNDDKLSLSILGYDVIIENAVFNGTSIICSSADITLPFGLLSQKTEITGLSFGIEGIRTPGISEKTFSVRQDGWNFKLKGLTLSDNGLGSDASLKLKRRLGGREISFPELVILPDGTVNTGVAANRAIVRIGGWLTEIEGISLEGDNVTATTGTVSTFSSMGGAQFVFPDIILNAGDGFVSSGIGDSIRTFSSENGFPVSAETYKLTNNGIQITGDVYFPAALGENSFATYSEESPIMLYYNGVIETDISSDEVGYKVAGWDVRGTEYFFSESGLYIGESEIDIPNTSVSIVLPELSFYSDGAFKVAGNSFENIDLPFFGGRFQMDKFCFNDRGLSAAAFIELPPTLGSYQIYFDELTILPDGSVTTKTSIPEFDFKLKEADLDFKFRNIRLDESALSIGEGILTLPEAMENRQVRISNFKISSDGSFNLGGIGFDPFEMWGYTFYLDNIGLSNTEVSFDGSIVLPPDLPQGIASKRLAISDFVYSIENNEVESFDVSLQGEFPFNLTDDLELVVDTLGIKKKNSEFLIYVNEGRLSFPDSLGIDQVAIYDVSINPKTGEFDFDNVSISGIEYTAFGLDFYLNKISFNSQFDITFQGTVDFPSTETVPELVRGQTLTISKFEIMHNGTIGDVDGSINLEGDLFEVMTLHEGNIRFAKLEEDLLIDVSGQLELSGASIPDGVRGKSILINEFQLNTTTWDVEKFDAGISGLEFNLFNLVTFKETSIAAGKTDDGKFEFDLIGDIYLPEALPEYIRKDPIHISDFTIDSTGSISAFHASKDFSGDNNLFGLITARDTHFEAEYDQAGDRVVFNINGTTIVLGETFPEGIRGTTAEINTFVFDSRGKIETVAVNTTIPDGKLFGSLPISNAGIDLTKDGDSDLLIDISGSLGMPDGSPEGLENVTIDIDRLAFTSTGTLEEVSIGASGISANILGVLQLNNGGIDVSKDGDAGLLFALSGDLAFPSSMPAPFSTMTFRLDPIAVSTTRGLVDFKAGITGAVTFDLFAGITGTFNTLDLSTTGISFSGSLSTPSGVPIIGGKNIVLETFEMNWDGEITEIAAGIDKLSTQLAGFTVDVENIVVHKDHVSIGKADLIMPSALKGQKVGLKDAKIKYNGEFEGTFTASDIKFDIAGFQLILATPSLNIDDSKIEFAKAYLQTPDIVGNSVLTLNNVSVGPDGLNFSGGGFELPSFKVANGLEFALKANFAIDGKEYFIDASGKIVIPGLGGFEVLASFTNVSNTYPWGLKRAYFAWEASGLGIPMGPTGIYMNGIRGGLAFGPPDELPNVVKRYFKNGTRIQIGFSMQTAGVSVIRGDVDAWIDVTNWYFAVQGKVSVLNGFFSSELTAAITDTMFYGRIAFQLKFVKGHVELWIWHEGKKVKIAGQGEVAFGVRKGAILNKKIWFVRVRIPSRDYWFGGIGAKFGDFTNGKKGFLGYVKVKIIGRIGLFVGTNGKLKLGKLKGYNLRVPGGPAYSRFGSPQLSVALEDDIGQFGVLDKETSLFDDSGNNDYIEPVLYLDSGSTYVTGEDTFLFTVPDETGKSKKTPKTLDLSLNRSKLQSEMDITHAEEVGSVERIIFVVGYEEGAPSITATSPSGSIYSSEFGNIEEFQIENGTAIVVMNPEPGEWTLNVNGLSENQPYTIDVMGKTRSPELSDLSPKYNGEESQGSFTVSGNAAWYGQEDAQVSVNLLSESGETLGVGVGYTTLTEQGEFSFDVDTSDVANGTYYVQYEIDDGEGIPLVLEAPGTIKVHNVQPIEPVSDIVVSRYDDDSIKVSFSAASSSRVKGYLLSIQNSTDTVERKIGNISQIILPGMEDGESYEIKITPYDSEGNYGIVSDVVSYTHEVETRNVNPPQIVNVDGNALPSQIDLRIGSYAEIEFMSKTSLFSENGDALDYGFIEVLEGPQWLSVLTDAPQYSLEGAEGLITLSSYDFTEESGDVISPSPGSYNVRIALKNLGNNELSDEYAFTLNVAYPAPVINDVVPASWHMFDETEITILGENFIPGTTFFLNEDELEVEKLQQQEATFIIPAGSQGGTNTIRVVGPDSSEATYPVEIVEPGYSVEVYKRIGNDLAGIEENFYFGLKGYERFDSSANFSVAQLPENGWSAQVTSSIVEGETGIITVIPPADAEIGEYPIQVVSDKGYELNLIHTVAINTDEPEIRLIYPPAVIAGKAISIYGNNFGDNTNGQGQVLLNGELMNVTAWEDDRIQVLTTADLQTGAVTVIRDDGTETEEAPLTIKDSGFVIYPEEKKLVMQPGDEIDIQVALKGAALPVDLECAAVDGNGNPSLNIALAETTVTPNGITFAHLTIPEDVENGFYTVVISGTSENCENHAEIAITIGEAFTITTQTLSDAMVDAAYYAEIKTENNVGDTSFSIKNGELPLGMSLSSKGVISGKPIEFGDTSFTIEAKDEEGHIVERTYSMAVTENVWSMTGKDEGRSNYIPASGPAFGTYEWTKDIQSEEMTDMKLIAGGGRIFAYGNSGISAMEQNNGYIIWETEDSVQKAIYLAGKLYVLHADSTYACYDAEFGNLLYSRSSVKNMIVNKGLLYLWESVATEGNSQINLVKILLNSSEDVPEGYVDTIIESVPEPNGKIFVYKEAVCSYSGSTVYMLSEQDETAQWIALINETDTISSVSVLNETLITSLTGGNMSVYQSTDDTGINKTAQLISGIVNGGTLLSENLFGVFGENGLVIYKADTMNEHIRFTGDIRNALFSKDKLYVTTVNKNMTVNIYDGSVMWSSDSQNGSYEGAIVTNGRLFTLEEDTVSQHHTVTAYSGVPNRDAPNVQVVFEPAEPDGNNGFYISEGTISVHVRDKESYVAENQWRIDSTVFSEYTGPVSVEEGIHSIVAYATDSEEKRSNDVVVSYNADLRDPETTLYIDTPTSQGTDRLWYATKPVFTLEATDNYSGVEYIEYRLNNGSWTMYSSPVTVHNEGINVLEYRAVDHAGRVEATRSIELAIDLSAPEVTRSISTEPGLGILRLYASDEGSGIESILYALDTVDDSLIEAGTWVEYTDPVIITEAGQYRVRYKAIDKAGCKSGEEIAFFTVAPYDAANIMLDLEYGKPLPGRRISEGVQAGDRIFANGRGRQNKFDAVPEYLEKGFYIQPFSNEIRIWNGDRTFVRFCAGLDMDIYLMVDPESGQNLDGWQLVEEGFQIESDYYYKDGVDIYRRSYIESDQVILELAEGWKVKPSLYVVSPANANGILITEPEGVLAPGDLIDITAEVMSGNVETTTVEVQIDEQVPALLQPSIDGTTVSAVYELPGITDMVGDTANVKVTVANDIAKRSAEFVILNQQNVQILNPAPGSQVICGTDLSFDIELYKPDGSVEENFETIASAVWETTRDIENPEWTTVIAGEGNLLTAPAGPGAWYVRVTYEGHSRQIQLNVVDESIAQVINFGTESEGDYVVGEQLVDGDGYNQSDSGIINGFSEDITNKVFIFNTVHLYRPSRGAHHQNYMNMMTYRSYFEMMKKNAWDRNLCKDDQDYFKHAWHHPTMPLHPSTVKESAILMGDDVIYKVRVNNGRYRVKVTTGPMHFAYGRTKLILNDESYNVMPRVFHRTMMRVETEVNVTDGWLTLSGENNISLSEFSFERIEDNTEEIETVIHFIPGIIITNIHWPYGFNPMYARSRFYWNGNRGVHR